MSKCERDIVKENRGKAVRIEICVGTTCFLLGANTFETLEEQIEARWPGQVDIQVSRCLGLCKGGKFQGAPYIKINSVPIGKASCELILGAVEEMLGRGRA